MPMHGKYARELGWKYSVLLPKKGIITSSRHSVVVETLREKDVGTLTLLVCVSSKKPLSETTVIVLQCIL